MNSCSHKSLKTNCNQFCDDLPTIDKQMFIENLNNKTFNVLMQTKAIKDCGCLAPELQKECYAKFQ